MKVWNDVAAIISFEEILSKFYHFFTVNFIHTSKTLIQFSVNSSHFDITYLINGLTFASTFVYTSLYFCNRQVKETNVCTLYFLKMK